MPQSETDHAFEPATLPFIHEAGLVNSLPFLASTAIDIDGYGTYELFLGGGDVQADVMFAFHNGEFKKLPLDFTKDAIGTAKMDIDNDGLANTQIKALDF